MKNLKFLIIILLLYACKNDDEVIAPCNAGDCPALENECLPFDWWQFNICHPNQMPSTDPCDYYANYDTLNYWGLVFNPKNSDEIGFMSNKLYSTWGGGPTTTCCLKFNVYNHRTNTKVWEFDIPDNIKLSSTPDWSENDIIIFSTPVYSKIYSLDISTGEFSYVMNGASPIWSPNGENFYFTASSSGSATGFLGNLNGEILDTITEFQPVFVTCDWSTSNKLLHGKSYWDFENEEGYSYNFPAGVSLSFHTQRWGANDDEVVIIGNDVGLGVLNIHDETFELLRPNCSGKLYGQLDVSRDKRYIAPHVSLWSLQEADTVYINQQIRVMNMDGTCERIVDVVPY